jgi:DNA-binding response OmpR family regulator
MSKTILVVEDHRETCEMIKAVLEESGFVSSCCATVVEALEFLTHNSPALMVLDLRLPDGDGLDICRHIRRTDRISGTPIIVFTGQDALVDKKKGFAAGVDQYLTKPIDMDELVMWVNALLQRVSMDKAGGMAFSLGELQMDAKAQLVRFRGRLMTDLTRREFELLYALAKNSPRVLPRREIIEAVWKTAAVDNLVDTHMFNLRKKLPPELSAKIHSVAGKGFRYLHED